MYTILRLANKIVVTSDNEQPYPIGGSEFVVKPGTNFVVRYDITVRVCPPGAPFVNEITYSFEPKDAIKDKSTTVTATGEIIGRVILLNFVHEFAPSTSAASYKSGEIFDNADKKYRIFVPKPVHIPPKASISVAVCLFPNQSILVSIIFNFTKIELTNPFILNILVNIRPTIAILITQGK